MSSALTVRTNLWRNSSPAYNRRNADHADAHVGEDSVEGRGELTGPISDKEPELRDSITKIHQQIADLLRSPPAIRVCGRAQQVHRPAADLQYKKDVDPLERHRTVHMEEVARQHRRRLRAQELPPRRVGASDRGWRYPQPLENAADRGRPNAVAEFEQLTLDSLVSPPLILPGMR